MTWSTSITPTSATALRPAPFGRALSDHGAAPIGSPPPVAVSDAPQLTYLIATEHDCTGYIRLNEETRAELQIGPLNSLDCISDEDLHAWLPAVQRGYATDGAEVSHYENRRAGLLASFDSAAGSPCLLSLSIRQEPRLIPRYQAGQAAAARVYGCRTASSFVVGTRRLAGATATCKATWTVMPPGRAARWTASSRTRR